MSNAPQTTPLFRPGVIASRVMAVHNFVQSRPLDSPPQTNRRCLVGVSTWLFLFLLAGEQPLGNHIVLGDPKDLVEGRLALDRLDDSVLEQSAHPLLASQSTYRLGRFSLERHLANLGGQGHELEDTHAAAIALLVAVIAPLALHEVGFLGQFWPQPQTSEDVRGWLVPHLALGTNFSHQALC